MPWRLVLIGNGSRSNRREPSTFRRKTENHSQDIGLLLSRKALNSQPPSCESCDWLLMLKMSFMSQFFKVQQTLKRKTWPYYKDYFLVFCGIICINAYDMKWYNAIMHYLHETDTMQRVNDIAYIWIFYLDCVNGDYIPVNERNDKRQYIFHT